MYILGEILLTEIRLLFADDQRPSGRPKLGDRASRADDHAAREGIAVAGAHLVRGRAHGSAAPGPRRAAQPHEAQVDVVGRDRILLVARKRLTLDRCGKQWPAGTTIGGDRAQALSARTTDTAELLTFSSLRRSAAASQHSVFAK